VGAEALSEEDNPRTPFPGQVAHPLGDHRPQQPVLLARVVDLASDSGDGRLEYCRVTVATSPRVSYCAAATAQ